MLKINKQAPPEGLNKLYEECKKQNLSPNDSYKKLSNPLKAEVIDSLMKEQGHLCAYCMRKIPDERELPEDTPNVSIEHIIPRNPIEFIDVNQGLDYNNMVAVCSGNRGKKGTRKRRDLTCDAKRDNKDLTINPLDPEAISQIKYTSDGEIFYEHQDKTINTLLNEDLNVRLNLNCSSNLVQLPLTRKEVLESFQKELSEISIPENLHDICEFYLTQYLNETDPKTPYSGIIIWWLRDMLNSTI